MIFSTIIVLALFALGITLGGVRMPVADFAKLLGTLVAGSLPFSAMGLALGYFAGPNSAPATINLIYLPMSFCSGLWVPFMFLPKVVRRSRLCCLRITCRNWRWESWERERMNRVRCTGKCWPRSP